MSEPLALLEIAHCTHQRIVSVRRKNGAATRENTVLAHRQTHFDR
jgi:hypothetical protein